MIAGHLQEKKGLYYMVLSLSLINISNVVLALFLFSVSRMKVGASAPTWPALLLLVAMNMTLFVVERCV